MLAPADRAALAGLLLTSCALFAGFALLGGEGRAGFPPTAADVVPYDGRSPRDVAGSEVRVLVELSRPAMGELAGLDGPAQRRYVASLTRESRALRSGLEARGIRLRDVVTYERLWNGFAATVRAGDVVRLADSGLHASPVRRFYPALSEPVELPVTMGRQAPTGLRRGGGQAPVCHARVAVVGGAYGDLLGQVVERGAACAEAVGSRRGHLRTDEVLAGLERAVDPDGDGVTDDRAAVALVGLSAPYAGFPDSPEAEAIAAARRLGLPVVVPAGHEGTGATIGSPGGAGAAVTVGALSAPEAVVRLRLTGGLPAALLGGMRPPRLRTSAVVSAEDPRQLLRPDAPRLQGTLAVVRAGANPGAQAAAAAAGGARAVLLAEPRRGRVLPAMPAGRVRVPVLGVTGEAAERVLALKPGTALTASAPHAGTGSPSLSRFSSRGPAMGGAAKPDVAAVGWADVVVRGAPRRIAGAGVGAARVAAALALGKKVPGVRGADAGAQPSGRLAKPRIGRIRLTRKAGKVTGVRFSIGLFVRGEPPAARPSRVQAIGRLDLRLVERRGRTVRRLALPGGNDLLPGDYGYAVRFSDLENLRAGRYRFRVRAFAPGASEPTIRDSTAFSR